MVHNNVDSTITATMQTQENSNGDLSAPVTKTFDLKITQELSTAGDDLLLFDGSVDGLAGDDTVVFGHDWLGGGIDFTTSGVSIKNIEVFDGTAHGDREIIINTTNVENMTDERNALGIKIDTNDKVTLRNDGDNVWAQQGSSDVYEGTNGAILSIDNAGGTIDDSALNATTGADVLGYNGDNVIDGGDGLDRLIIFDGAAIDFSKMKNIETIDLSIKGDHDMGTLTLTDVVSITDSNKQLTIEGDDTNDKVSFSTADGWIQGASSGGYTEYTNSGDSTVLVKVDDDIAVTVV